MSLWRLLAYIALTASPACRAAGPRLERPAIVIGPQDTALLAHAKDTSLLVAVVRALRSDAGPLPVVVDPRPLVAKSELFDVARGFATVPETTLRARERALRGGGAESGDAVALGQNSSCPGILFSPGRGDENPHARCPKRAMYVAAIGLPRPGTARPSPVEVYDPVRMRAAEGYWAVRVVRTIVGPRGSSVSHNDYVMQRDALGWKFIKAVPLLYTE